MNRFAVSPQQSHPSAYRPMQVSPVVPVPAPADDPVKAVLDGIGAAIGASLVAQNAFDVQSMVVGLMGKTYEDCRRQLVQPMQLGPFSIVLQLPATLASFVPPKNCPVPAQAPAPTPVVASDPLCA